LNQLSWRDDFKLICYKSSWARSLDHDDMTYLKDIVNITSNLSSLDDKVGADLEKFDDAMEVMAKRPKQPSANWYSNRVQRRDVAKLSAILSCLQKKGTFPLPKEDFSFLCNIFFSLH
jgi:hypothetical protein